MLLTRGVYLLLAFIVALMVSQPADWVLGSVAQMAPGGALLMLAAVLVSAAVEFFAGILEGDIEHESDDRVDLVWPRGARVGLEHRPDAPPGVDRLEVEGLADELTVIGTRFVPV